MMKRGRSLASKMQLQMTKI